MDRIQIISRYGNKKRKQSQLSGPHAISSTKLEYSQRRRLMTRQTTKRCIHSFFKGNEWRWWKGVLDIGNKYGSVPPHQKWTRMLLHYSTEIQLFTGDHSSLPIAGKQPPGLCFQRSSWRCETGKHEHFLKDLLKSLWIAIAFIACILGSLYRIFSTQE